MDQNTKLLNDLAHLRYRIKESERYRLGRAPIVCTDQAIREMVRLLPKKIEDFSCVPGLGQTFIDNYGEKFLDVILQFTQTPETSVVKMNYETKATLKELEKKLVNINRRNRLLYMPKAVNKYAYDLYDELEKYDPLKILFGKAGQVICRIDDISPLKGQSGIDKYRRLVQLIREVNKDIRDKGQNDFFIGYPFVEGRLTGENFDIRAPLALFPVIVERETQYIKVKLDDSRDIVYNNTLVLANYKFSNITRSLPNNTIDDLAQETFMQDLISFFNETGIEIKDDRGPIRKFIEYNASEFPVFSSGEFHLVRNIVLGKFPTYSSSIQKDFNEIIDQNILNSLLSDLIAGIDEIDYYSDSYFGEKEPIQNEKPLDISEKSLVYINELDNSQEMVISSCERFDELVIQGPPGTGKSQTITNLISSFINNEKTVLMVSEKKTALDVVYSRLGELSGYSLLIDDVGNKTLFYQQLENILTAPSIYNTTADLLSISEGIDTMISYLEEIARKLYSINSFGIEPYKLYLINQRVDLTNSEQLSIYKKYKDSVTSELLEIDYSTLEKLKKTFTSQPLLANLYKYKEFIKEYEWLNDLKENLNDFEVIQFSEKLEKLASEISVWREKNFFRRIFTRGTITKQIEAIIKQCFIKHNKEISKLLLLNTLNVKESLCKYTDFIEVKPLYTTLSGIELEYFNAVFHIGDLSEKSNTDLYNYLIFEHIQKFQSENRDLFQKIQSFDGIILSLSQAIAQKRQLSRDHLKRILSENLSHILLSKRKGEISRIIESRRKWSLNKFIKKFDFELFKGIKIWLLTPEVVSEILPLQVGLFDLVIFDEASQMYVEKGIPSIIRGKKVVIAGDHKQLRPSNLGSGRLEVDEELIEDDTENSAALEEESLLDLARFRYKDFLLKFHYRSKYEELIAFSNYAFYKGRLYVSPNAEHPNKPPIEVHMVNDALWVNRSNLQEAREVVSLLKDFFKHRKENETIGVITFNSSQRDLIDDLIEEECAKDIEFSIVIQTELARKDNGEDIGLFVKNIESVQGDERDVIMFSIGYAKNQNGRLVRNFGWLNQKGGENRLNVAITRAKKKIHIVTSFEPSELQVEDAKNDGPKILRKYLEYASAISNGYTDKAQQILLSFGDAENSTHAITFDSDFENQVYDALIEKGYQVETQVGIGGYSIDLAIKRNGKYILGIECDGKLYHSSKSARERDYHRQKYLESRGWRIHRIWSTNWWKNSNAEINKICNLVESL